MRDKLLFFLHVYMHLKCYRWNIAGDKRYWLTKIWVGLLNVIFFNNRYKKNILSSLLIFEAYYKMSKTEIFNLLNNCVLIILNICFLYFIKTLFDRTFWPYRPIFNVDYLLAVFLFFIILTYHIISMLFQSKLIIIVKVSLRKITNCIYVQ